MRRPYLAAPLLLAFVGIAAGPGACALACGVSPAPGEGLAEEPEAVKPPAAPPPGPGCWAWVGRSLVYGRETATGCCAGCIDGQSKCHVGGGVAVCGIGGGACANGAPCVGADGAGLCKNGVCCPPVMIDQDSGLPVGKDCGNL